MAERHVTVSRQDRILNQWLEFWERNRLQLIGVLVFVLVVLGAWGASVYYKSYQEGKAASLYAALPETGEMRREGLETIARDFPETGVGVYSAFILAREDYEQEKYDQALSWYNPLTDLSGRRAMIGIMSLNNSALIYEAQGEWTKALEIYKKVAADPENPASAYAYYNMGRVAQNLGDSDEARRWYQEAAERGTGLPVAERAKDRLLWLNIGSQ